MATYYVRTDGNDGNTGLGSGTGQAWATVGKALGATGITSGDTVYIAPGTYREVVTIVGTYSSATYIYGNPTASQFSGVTAGEVRITPSGSDNAVSTSFALTATSKNNLNFRDLIIGGMNITQSSNMTIERCLLFSTSATTQAFLFINGNNGNYNTTIKQSVVTGTVAGIEYRYTNSGAAWTAGLYISDCFITGLNAIYMNNTGVFGQYPAGSVTVYNSVLMGYVPYLYNQSFGTAISTGNNIKVYNSLLYATGTYVFQCGTVGFDENYNRVYGINTRINATQGANTTVASWPGLEFGQSLLQGYGPIQIFGNTFNSANATAGTASGAPAVDMYGQSWNVTPDIGVAIYRTIGGVGAYLPAAQAAGTITIAPGSTSQSIELYLGATGLTASTSGLSARYNRTRTASVSIPLVARTIAQAWTAGGFAEVDATNMPGIYRLDLPDAALDAGADDVTIVVRGASGTNGAVMTVKLSSGGLTSAQTASAVWGASPAGYNDATTFGGVVNQIDQTVTGIDTQVQDVAGNVWDELKANHTIPNSFGDYLDTKVSTGADTSRIQLRQGPFLIKQNAIDSVITEVNQFLSTVPNIEMVLIDSSGGSVSVAGATLVMRVRNQAGAAVVNNVTPTVAYADGGVIRWSPNLSWTALGVTTAGTYRIVVERTMSGVTTTFGPFLVQLSSG